VTRRTHHTADRKLTKPELILRLRRDDGQLAQLIGLPGPSVSTMEEHRNFNQVFELLDCQRGSRGAITFPEFEEYMDRQYNADRATWSWVGMTAIGLGLAVVVCFAFAWRMQRRRENEKSE
jgi:hypothetical protein